jgi:hypothetical protein
MTISNTHLANSSYSSVRDNAQTGLSQQLDNFEKNAAKIAENASGTTDTNPEQIKSLIDQLDIVNQVKANLRTLQADNERIGTLIDLRA